MESMVLGFVFNGSGDDVLLIRKARPKWQAGYLNGIGGHIEPGESPVEAMARECLEETGLVVGEWDPVITFTCKGGTVFVFRAFCDAIYDAVSKTDEPIYLSPVSALPKDALDNLFWMIPMVQDNLRFPVLLAYDNLGGCRQEAGG